ncbi:hypothetical protein CXB51_002782 [Gossypium anomalum]|uniref:Pectinesterase inhibitor domain-containing protein n=1 Tax=Gossypium anomalum TaxID=47600 RepID=A0A8J6D9N2_9ROSI|nr:hypothetical protein CXB51_002782 [Gossypium anomalum]
MLSFNNFLVIFSLSSLSTSAVLPNTNVPLSKVKTPLPVASSKLVGNFCNDESIGNHSFCLEALSIPKVVAVKDSTQLGILIMKLGVANAKATLNIYNEMIKKPSQNSPSSSFIKTSRNFCNDESIGNRSFDLEALSNPEAFVAKDSTQLEIIIMKLGAANAKETLNIYNEMIKKPSSPQLLKALNYCVAAYKYASLSFEMVSSELVEDCRTANYDVTIIDPEITNCEKELLDTKVQEPRLLPEIDLCTIIFQWDVK